MKRIWRSIILWLILTIALFTFLWWMFRIAIPDAALEFALGVTLLVVTGLIVGRYGSRIWLGAHTSNAVFYILVFILVAGVIALGMLVNQMIGKTQFVHFLSAMLVLVIISACISALITLSRDRMNQKLAAAQTAMAVSKSELQLLQSQLSPHFLFNTLNNIYGLSITDHERVPELLLKLSNLLRYSVYEVKELFVPLQDEIRYIKNYLDFERLRLGEAVDLQVDLHEVNTETYSIAPMLLVVFVENAFKHSRGGRGKKAVIEIVLRRTSSALHFSVINTRPAGFAKSELDQKHSGFGLDSVKKRLQLLYANRYTLDFRETPGHYEIQLTLIDR